VLEHPGQERRRTPLDKGAATEEGTENTKRGTVRRGHLHEPRKEVERGWCLTRGKGKGSGSRGEETSRVPQKKGKFPEAGRRLARRRRNREPKCRTPTSPGGKLSADQESVKKASWKKASRKEQGTSERTV